VRRLMILLAAGLLTVLAAQPAAAQAGTSYPSGFISTNHGRAVFTVHHPTIRDWFVDVAVDVHFGYNTASADADTEFASPVGRISKGAGAARVQHEGTHLGYESDLPIVRDCRPINGQPRNRQNELSPCAYINSGDAGRQVLASQDWRRLRCTDSRVAARFYFSVRWLDGTLTRSSQRSNYVEHDLNGCAADLAVDKIATEGTNNKTTYRVGDTFVYQIDATNFGPDRPNTTIIDTLPAGLSAPVNFDAGPGGTCSYAATTRRITCTYAAMTVGVHPITFLTTVLAGASGTLTNMATISGADTSDPNLANNSDSYSLTPAPPSTTTTTTT
jgi:uncharacterized repeat protein (TIGR01451 family)